MNLNNYFRHIGLPISDLSDIEIGNARILCQKVFEQLSKSVTLPKQRLPLLNPGSDVPLDFEQHIGARTGRVDHYENVLDLFLINTRMLPDIY